MGQLNVDRLSVEARRAFTRSLLADVRALDRMLASDALESGCRRIGCEQEMFLVDRTWMANPVGPDLLESLEDGHFTTELGRFNLELNLDPITFGDDCLSRMESELHARLSKAREVAKAFDTEIVLTGILPSLRKSDLTLDNMTPRERYHALNDALGRLCGGDWQFHLEAADQLNVRQDSIMLEACCTSFQVHYQADAATFPQLYNAAQAITGPLLAAAANSPLLFGRRLWSETRIPLFQQAV
ncbi:MAG TPA: glutamate-cysteine ligase family protein, partial [Terriglobia bacterium]|nr:glutamate-cysteine ligase family protein [Terriglobia bacterium]